MAELQDKIEADLKSALKNRNDVELSTLRLLKSEIQYESTKGGASAMTDADIEGVVKRAIKKRKESIEQFQKAGRQDMADKEQAELVVLERYLPPAVSEAEIQQAIDEIFEKVKPEGPKDMGKVMGPVMAKFKGQNIDGSIVRELVQTRLKG